MLSNKMSNIKKRLKKIQQNIFHYSTDKGNSIKKNSKLCNFFKVPSRNKQTNK